MYVYAAIKVPKNHKNFSYQECPLKFLGVLLKTKVSYNFSDSKPKKPQAIIRSKVLMKDFCGLCAGTGQID